MNDYFDVNKFVDKMDSSYNEDFADGFAPDLQKGLKITNLVLKN